MRGKAMLGVSTVLAALCLASGCMRPPRLVGPQGSEVYQRNHAALHDPYPDVDMGPEIVGGRPREFEKPLAEPVRNRWLRDFFWQR